jgi:hypothetical protein
MMMPPVKIFERMGVLRFASWDQKRLAFFDVALFAIRVDGGTIQRPSVVLIDFGYADLVVAIWG